jgi:hypothetical protein
MLKEDKLKLINNLTEISDELTNIELSIQRKYLVEKLYLEKIKKILKDSYEKYNTILKLSEFGCIRQNEYI